MSQETITEETKQKVMDKILAVFREYNLNYSDTDRILMDLRREAPKKYFQE